MQTKDDDIRGRAAEIAQVAPECRVISLQTWQLGTTQSLGLFSMEVELQGLQTTEELHTRLNLRLYCGRCLTIVATECTSVCGIHNHNVQISPSAAYIPNGLAQDTHEECSRSNGKGHQPLHWISELEPLHENLRTASGSCQSIKMLTSTLLILGIVPVSFSWTLYVAPRPQ